MWRRPVLPWAVAVTLALTAGAIVAHTTADAARRRDGYGLSRPVLVTETQVASGGRLAGAVVTRSLPLAAIPDDALDAVDPVATASGPISAGAVVTRQDLAGASGLGADEAAIALSAGPAMAASVPGTAVWVIVAADPFAGVASALVPGRILSTTDDEVTVVVAVADLATVSTAAGAAVAGLALRGE